jgi:hypothetical protein
MNWYKKKFASDFYGEDYINEKYDNGEDMWNEEEKKKMRFRDKEGRAMSFLAAEIEDIQRVVINILREQTPFNKRMLDIFEDYIGKPGGDWTDILSIANATIQKAHNVAEITYPDLVAAVNKMEFLIDEYDKKRDTVWG